MGVAPFDVIADFLRGTEGTAIDMFRQPEKLLEAIDMITGLTITRLTAGKGQSISFPLHKGDDTFMSRKQFEKFYWPSLKKVIDALIEAGIMVTLFAEGSYNQRLEYIGDFPKGWVTWMFDQTDMARAKKMIGDKCCICGNVPASIVITGTPQQVKEACRKLIENCAPGGGYILAGGCTATETKNPANFRAFMEAAKEYGVYK
jgi:uroporphyrinogen-III decarboxylase